MISRGQAGLLCYIVLTRSRMKGGGAGEGREEGGRVEEQWEVKGKKGRRKGKK